MFMEKNLVCNDIVKGKRKDRDESKSTCYFKLRDHCNQVIVEFIITTSIPISP